MTNMEYHSEELERRHEKQSARLNNSTKGAKLLALSTKIGEHDLMTGVRKMVKLLDKQYEVKVVVTGDGENATDKWVSSCDIHYTYFSVVKATSSLKYFHPTTQ